MDRFEFLSVLPSIVLAIAVTEILGALGGMIRLRHDVRPHPVHVGWMGLVLVLSIQFWWSLWDRRGSAEQGFVAYLASLMPYFTLVVLAHYLTPDPEHDDLETYYLRNARGFFLIGSTLLLELIVTDSLLHGEPWLSPNNGIRLVGMLLTLGLAQARRMSVHLLALLACYVLFAVFMAGAATGA